MSSNRLKVLHITPMYPSEERPYFGSFVKSQIDSLKDFVEIELLVLPGLRGIWPYIKNIPAILSKLNGQYDIIHIHYGNVSTLIKLLYFGKTPIVTSYCGDDLQGTLGKHGGSTLKSIFFKRANRFFSRYDSCSITKSESLSTYIKGVARNIIVIPNGVNLSQFKVIDKVTARKKIGVSEKLEKVVLFPAAINRPAKNFSFLKRVIEKLDNSHTYQIITFETGNVNHDIAQYYFNAADLVVFTSLSEGSPNVIKEAMACNAKIYSTNCGDVSWLLDGVKGAKVLPLVEHEWMKAITEFFSNKQNGQLPMSNAREVLIEKGLDTNTIAQKILKLYNSIVNKK